MSDSSQNKSKPPRKFQTIAELYPELSLAEQPKAEYFLHRYLDLITRIYERLERDAKLPKILRQASRDESAQPMPPETIGKPTQDLTD